MSEGDYEALRRAAESRVGVEDDLPEFPKPFKDGSVPASEFTRVAIARDIILARRAVGLSQQALADLAGVRQETLSRIETAKNAVSVPTIEKIDRALKKAERARLRQSSKNKAVARATKTSQARKKAVN